MYLFGWFYAFICLLLVALFFIEAFVVNLFVAQFFVAVLVLYENVFLCTSSGFGCFDCARDLFCDSFLYFCLCERLFWIGVFV